MIQKQINYYEVRTIKVAPKIVKILSNGTRIVSYHWQGAEQAEIVDQEYKDSFRAGQTLARWICDIGNSYEKKMD